MDNEEDKKVNTGEDNAENNNEDKDNEDIETEDKDNPGNEDGAGSEEDDDGEDGNDDKNKEDSPYKAQLDKIEEEKKQKEEQLRQKNGALKEEREKRKDIEKTLEKDGFVKKDDLDAYIDSKLSKRDLDAKISNVASSDEEAKVIKHYVEEKNLSVDEAKVLANKHKVEEFDKIKEQENQYYSTMPGYMGNQEGSAPTKGAKAYEKDPILKAAAAEMDPEDRKYLSRN